MVRWREKMALYLYIREYKGFSVTDTFSIYFFHLHFTYGYKYRKLLPLVYCRTEYCRAEWSKIVFCQFFRRQEFFSAEKSGFCFRSNTEHWPRWEKVFYLSDNAGSYIYPSRTVYVYIFSVSVSPSIYYSMCRSIQYISSNQTCSVFLCDDH